MIGGLGGYSLAPTALSTSSASGGVNIVGNITGGSLADLLRATNSLGDYTSPYNGGSYDTGDTYIGLRGRVAGVPLVPLLLIGGVAVVGLVIFMRS